MKIRTLIVLITLITIAQFKFYGLSLPLLTMIIARILFFSRLFGMKTTFAAVAAMEVAAMIIYVITPMITRAGYKWVDLLILAGLTFIAFVIEWYDSVTYLYIEEEIHETKDRKGNSI